MKAILVLLMFCPPLLGETFDTQLRVAQQRYDLAQATKLVEELRRVEDETERATLLPQALLLTTELLRIDFEALPDKQHAERRALGKSIDGNAKEALEILKGVPESSEAWRVRADLYGVMIRTKYQANKYGKRMEEAIEKALTLDPMNPRAYVSAAKPCLFAEAGNRRDLAQANEFLAKAIECNPELESAWLLKAFAQEEAQERDKAVDTYKKILERNPTCQPAKERLESLTVP